MINRVALFLLVLINYYETISGDQPWPCNKTEAIEAFKLKTLQNPFPPLTNDPYDNQTTASMQNILQTLNNTEIVCALKYTTPDRKNYVLQTFVDASQALSAGYIITHQGRCGVCSNVVDLAVYLEQPDLTDPVRKCALKTMVSDNWSLKCILDLGFSENCAYIWLYNSINTRKECLGVCLKIWITGAPPNKPDGSLNDCLQCDEDKSGPVFKYFSGRTRRDSGIISAIERPGAQVYNMTHCYF